MVQIDIYTNGHLYKCSLDMKVKSRFLSSLGDILFSKWLESLFQNLILVLDLSLLQFFSAKSQVIL